MALRIPPELLQALAQHHNEAWVKEYMPYVEEASRLDEMDKHRGPGGLLAFVKYFWPVLEPDTEMVQGWPLEAICTHLEAAARGETNRLLMTVCPGFAKSLLTNVFFPAWVWGPLRQPQKRFISFSYSSALTERDNDKFRTLVSSEKYQRMYGPLKMRFKEAERVDNVDGVELRNKTTIKVMNKRTGWKLASSVGGVATGERGDYVLIDDAHSVVEAESERIREETVRWFREAVPSRFNNLDTGCLIIIMQRTHYSDIAGVALGPEFNYTHLMIPWEFDPSRAFGNDGSLYMNSLGWRDPRADPNDPDANAGMAAWPARFSEHAIARIKSEIGPYAWCCPSESPVLMADLSMKPISEVNAGDEVVGFTTETNGAKNRRALTKAKVLGVNRLVAPVVKITLESGEIIRCTAEHNWYIGKEGGCRGKGDFRPLYRPAKIGRKLMRVCPSHLPDLTPYEERLAGWLSGFFDGEGSVSKIHKRGQVRPSGEQYRPTNVIEFYQTEGKNLPLCRKLEASLSTLGFSFSVERRKRAQAHWEQGRQYRLKGPSLPLAQRFLHIAQPTKWRDRIIEGAYGSKFIIAQEGVVSIEPDGVEPVYALETTTGNYVVWGLASSNSAQYQQSPVPRGQGIFKREWWQLWDPPDGKFPLFSYTLASLDGAFTEDEENDYCACTVFGVFAEPGTSDGDWDERTGKLWQVRSDHQRRLMLVHAWRKHLQFSAPRVPRLTEPTVINGATWPADYVEPGMDENQVKFRNSYYKRRTQAQWGLIEWAMETCLQFKVDALLIEAAASGISAAQEIRNRMVNPPFAIHLVKPKGDKVARALSVQPTFSNLLVYAPDREWAEMVIEEMEMFPRGKHDDLTDTVTQALKFLRERGMARNAEEITFEARERITHRPRQKALYDI